MPPPPPAMHFFRLCFFFSSLYVSEEENAVCKHSQNVTFYMVAFHYIQETVLLPLRGCLYSIYDATYHWHPPIATQANWVIVSGVVTSLHRRKHYEHNDIVQLLLMLSPVGIWIGTIRYRVYSLV